jgi:hypothetical protein
MSARRNIPLGFTDVEAQEGMHICYIYADEDERREVVSKFLESGLRAREKVLCLLDTPGNLELLDRLADLGVPDSALTVMDAARGYCPSGQFRTEQTLDLVRAFYDAAVHEEGYAGARGTGQMAWCLDPALASTRDVIEYESRVNLMLAEHPYTACCQYDARRFSGQMIMDVLSIHPMMIIRGQIVKNPFYIEPDVFLKEFRARA